MTMMRERPAKAERTSEVTVHRLMQPEDVPQIRFMLEAFHEKLPGLGYPLAQTLSAIQAAVGRLDNYILVAYDAGRGKYLGYLWAIANQAGDVFVHQMYSVDPRAGRGLVDGLMYYSLKTGMHRWDALIHLEPGEASQLLTCKGMRRLSALCKRYGAGPTAVWVRKKLPGGGH
jgi:hypothetical protein